MNIAIFMKWWWKFKDPNYTSTWKLIITTKYFLGTQSMVPSPLWSAILSLETLGKISTSYTLMVNTSVLFWKYIWDKSCSMASSFSKLFSICSNPDIQLQEVINSGGVTFRRHLTDVEIQEWLHILSILSHISTLMTLIK